MDLLLQAKCSLQIFLTKIYLSSTYHSPASYVYIYFAYIAVIIFFASKGYYSRDNFKIAGKGNTQYFQTMSIKHGQVSKALIC